MQAIEHTGLAIYKTQVFQNNLSNTLRKHFPIKITKRAHSKGASKCLHLYTIHH
jgi:hypothetical protein